MPMIKYYLLNQQKACKAESISCLQNSTFVLSVWRIGYFPVIGVICICAHYGPIIIIIMAGMAVLLTWLASDSTEESVFVKSRRKHLTKVKNRYRHSGRSTAISTAEPVDECDTVPRRRTARATAGRNANPYNVPRSATLRTTAVVVQPSFGELSEAMANLGAELSSSLGSMIQGLVNVTCLKG